MADYSDALAVQDLMQKEGERRFGVRPKAVGLYTIRRGDFGVSVVLPRRAMVELPATERGVPLRFAFEVEPATALAGPGFDGAPARAHRRTG